MFCKLMAHTKSDSALSVMDQPVTQIPHAGAHYSFSAPTKDFVRNGSAVRTATEYLSSSIAATHGEGTEVSLLARPPPVHPCRTLPVDGPCIKSGETLV